MPYHTSSTGIHAAACQNSEKDGQRNRLQQGNRDCCRPLQSDFACIECNCVTENTP